MRFAFFVVFLQASTRSDPDRGNVMNDANGSQENKESETRASGLSREAETIMRFEANKKSAVIAYVLWFFLGALGAHRFYLKRNLTALAILALTILSAVLSAVGVGFLLFTVVGVWLIVDIFLIPGMTSSYNNGLIDKSV